MRILSYSFILRGLFSFLYPIAFSCGVFFSLLLPVFFPAPSMLWGEAGGKTKGFWFLLPGSRLEGYKGLRHRYFRLLSAPKLKVNEILAFSREYEKKLFPFLDKERRDVKRSLRALRESERDKELARLGKERGRQLALWRASQKHYLASVENYLKERRRLGKLDPSLFKLIEENFNLLKKMQSKRQEGVLELWRDSFRLWEGLDERAFAAEEGPGTKRVRESLHEILGEKFFPSYYLAMYRFLELFPLAERRAFLLHIQPTKFR